MLLIYDKLVPKMSTKQLHNKLIQKISTTQLFLVLICLASIVYSASLPKAA